MNISRALGGSLALLTVLAPAFGGTLYLTNDQNLLLRIDSATPGVIQATAGINGLDQGDSIVGIDYRPATGVLYGLGSSSRLYTIDTATGMATGVGAAGQFTLAGSAFGFDFNPVPDRIRVTSDTTQNLRLNPNNGALGATDGNLAYSAGDANAGATPNIVGSGYTNSIAGATTTTLYGIDSSLGILVIQNPPNNGTLNTVGSLGVSITDQVGFDILPVSGIAFASFTSAPVGAVGFSSLYTIDRSTGAASLVGVIGAGNQRITGLAAVSDIPEPSSIVLFSAGAAAIIWYRRRRTA